MLSVDQVSQFLSAQLNFKNWREILKDDKLKFLELLVRYYAHNNYFQNISMSSIPEECRKVPGETDIIKAGLNGVGGNCITQNTFLMYLLKTLGFDTWIVSSWVYGANYFADNHVMCVVQLNARESYLLDLGVALPFHEPIPLHNLPYTNRAAGLRYVYRKSATDSELFERVQLDGPLFGEGRYEDSSTEYVRYIFTLKPRTVEFFIEPLTDIFKSKSSNFLTGLFLFRYFAENENGEMCEDAQLDGDRKFIIVRDLTVLIGSDETKTIKRFANYDEIKDLLFKYFPKFERTTVEKSIGYYNLYSKNQ